MATTVVPTAGSEAPASAAPAAPEGGTATDSPEARRERAMALAAERGIPGAPGIDPLPPNAVDAALEAANRAARNPDPLAGATLEDVLGAEDVPAEGADGEATEAAAEGAEAVEGAEVAAGEEGVEGAEGDSIAIEIPIPGSETPFILDADPETAEVIGGLIQRAARAERATAIREEAQAMREEVEEFHYQVEMDPTGVLDRILLEAPTDRAETPRERQAREADTDHLFLKLITKPGLLERNLDVVGKMIDNPETIEAYAEKVELERLKRRNVVQAEIEDRRAYRNYERRLEGTILKTIASVAPETFSDDARAMMYRDVRRQVDDLCREKNFRAIDLARIGPMVQQRFSYLGIAPKYANQQDPASGGKTGSPGSGQKKAVTARTPVAPTPADAVRPTPSVAPSAKTVTELKAASARREGAASAPPGAGAAANAMPVRPAFDPNMKDASGVPIPAVKQASNWARTVLLPWRNARPK